MSKVIRSPEFAQRFEMACDQQPHCPPLHKGRYQWIVDEFRKRYKESISTETVRKWHSGEARPKQDKNALVAQLLGVDATWLYMGVDPDLEPRERKARNAVADGAVNVVAGMIQMDGGNPAFPDKEGVVDLHAIIKGVKYDFHVSMIDEDGRAVVPTKYEGVIVLGVSRDGMNFTVVEIPQETIEAGQRRGGSIEVDASGLKPISGFDRRL